MLADLKDKISKDDEDKIKKELENVKAAIASDDTERIQRATDDLTKVFYEISSRLYQQGAQANPGNQNFTGTNPNAGQTGSSQSKDEKVVDADYKVVDDDSNA